MTDQPADYDSPWKEAISRYFPPFMEFFFPQAYANINLIDWMMSLPKDLQRGFKQEILRYEEQVT